MDRVRAVRMGLMLIVLGVIFFVVGVMNRYEDEKRRDARAVTFEELESGKIADGSYVALGPHVRRYDLALLAGSSQGSVALAYYPLARDLQQPITAILVRSVEHEGESRDFPSTPSKRNRIEGVYHPNLSSLTTQELGPISGKFGPTEKLRLLEVKQPVSGTTNLLSIFGGMMLAVVGLGICVKGLRLPV